MADSKMVATFKKVIVNNNSWVLFEHGTVVIFSPEEAARLNLREEAVRRLRSLEIRTDVVVAEWLGQGRGWIVNCGDDFILNYVPHDGDYVGRYDRIVEMRKHQINDQQGLKIIHVEKRG